MAKPPVPSTLTEPEGAAWGGFLRAHAMITRQLDADLRASSSLSLSEFEILLHLAWAGGERRMAQIAQDLVLTGGGVTRIVARLEKLGLLKRRACPQDGRGILAALTEKGWAKQRSAHQVHLDGVRRLFLGTASDPELKVLGRLFGRMADQARSTAPSSGAACDLDGSKEPASRPRRTRPAP